MAALGVFLAGAGLVGGTVGYGAYYRGERYRLHVERLLTGFFGLPTDIGRIRPHTLHSRELLDVQMWLPARRGRIFQCPRVIWDTSGGETAEGTIVHLYDADMTVGGEEWENEDYMRVLRASLLHNFTDLDIRQVRFHNASLRRPRRDFQLRAAGVDGNIVFDDEGRALAELTSRSLNEIEVSEPIRIQARIDPHLTDDFLPEVTLQVPVLPLSGLGLDQALSSPVTQGSFEGRITLRQSAAADVVELSGLAQDLRLEELTHRVPGGAVRGIVDLTIHRAVVERDRLVTLRFSGEVRDLEVDSLLARFGWSAIGGRVHLHVYNGLADQDTIHRLGLSGSWTGGSLNELSRTLLGSPGVQGDLTVRVNSLIIAENELASGDIDLIARPAEGRPGTIARSLLVDLLEQQLGVKLPRLITSLLPEQVEYVRMGAKLLIDGSRLRVLNLGEGADSSILTIKIGDRQIPLVAGIDRVFDLKPLVDKAREHAEQLKQNLQQRRRRP